VKVDEKADRTVVPGNISQAESQKGVLSKSTDTDKNNNNIAVPTQAPKASGAYPKCNGHASKMAMATLPFPLPTLRATFSHSWQNVEQTQTQTQTQTQLRRRWRNITKLVSVAAPQRCNSRPPFYPPPLTKGLRISQAGGDFFNFFCFVFWGVNQSTEQWRRNVRKFKRF